MLAPNSGGSLQHVARYLSILGHPFIVIPASIAALAVLRGGDLRSALVVAGVFAAASVAILVGIRAGRFNNFDVSERERRPSFYLLVTAGTAALAFRFRDQPQALLACVCAGVVLVCCTLINRWTKISLHTAFSLYAAGLWGTWSLVAGITALPIAASIGWSRVRLGRHSKAEVYAGVVVGIAAALCMVSFGRLLR